MINSMTVTNYLGESLKIDLRNPETSGFLVSNIDGLGPVESNINITDITTNDGGIYNSARIGSRNITLQLVYFTDSGEDVERLRHKTYKYFPSKKNVTLYFDTDYRHGSIVGYVESNSVSIYSKTQYSSISIICPNPFFEAHDIDSKIKVYFYGIEPKMRFPLRTAINIVPQQKIVCGNITSASEKVVNYTGDSETGMIITIHALGSAGNVTIFNSITNESMTINSTTLSALTGNGIIAGDTITISTLRGNKTITLLRSGIYTNILNCLDKNAKWLQLRKGDNVLAFSSTSGFSNLELSIEATVIYEGI